MIRLALRLAPVALLAVPLVVYRNHFEDIDRARTWGRHTVEARQVADRMVLHAGCVPALIKLREDLEEFARTTADNPVQVAHVAAIRKALDPFDAAEVARVAALASAEEERLLAIRRKALQSRLDEARRLADWVFGIGLAVIALHELGDFLFRKTRPPAPPEPPKGRWGRP